MIKDSSQVRWRVQKLESNEEGEGEWWQAAVQ